MTIYIAICDDNIADRKHLERLLEREKDSRLHSNSDVLYIESFGSEEALMRTPVKYDIFFIDMCESTCNGFDIAKKLRKNGIGAPIVLCSKTIDYTSFVNTLSNIIFMNKTLNSGQISHCIDVASEWSKNKTPLLEIRGMQDTHFIKYTDLIRATQKSKFVTEIAISDGAIIEIADSIKSIELLCKPFNCFMNCGKSFINISHITSSDNDVFILSNGDKIFYSMFEYKYIIRKMANYISSIESK